VKEFADRDWVNLQNFSHVL